MTAAAAADPTWARLIDLFSEIVHELSFALWSYGTGQRGCTADHDTPAMRAGQACPTCKAAI